VAAASMAAGAAMAQIPPDVAAALKEIGPRIEAQKTTALYAPLQPKDMYAGTYVSRDLAYGPHERHRLDVFTSARPGGGAKPVLVFVHGGGFVGGSKGRPGSPYYDNIGTWAAKNGLVGVTMNYRLAPANKFPSGGEDVGAAVKWLKENVAKYGGDPNRIYLWGHSVGAVHVADYVAHTHIQPKGGPGVRGIVLTSGQIYDGEGPNVTPAYYGEDKSKYAAMASLPGLVKSKVPVFMNLAEFDPPAFRAQGEKLHEALVKAGRRPTFVELKGHSHISETYAVGTDDRSLSDPVLKFVRGR
jgi:triacylglycerol lipase